MIPISSESQKNEILAVADLIKSEVNVKEIEVLEDASDILVKQIKPNFKVLGPRFGKDMKAVAQAVNNFNADDIKNIEQNGNLDVEVNGKTITLERTDVEIISQDIEGWLVANEGALTVALDVTISPEYISKNIKIMGENTVRFSDTDLAEFKTLITEKIAKAQHDLELIKSAYMNDHNNGTEDTSPQFKAFDEGSAVMSKESNSQLAIRQEKFIRDLKSALIRIENKTYGICRVMVLMFLVGLKLFLLKMMEWPGALKLVILCLLYPIEPRK